MPRRSPVSVQAQVITALQKYTQKQLAARIGVGERTIRRWLTGTTEPAPHMIFARYALQDEFKSVRRAIRTRTKREAPNAHPPEVQIPLLGERRMLVQYDEHGKDTGGRYESDWVNYNVSALPVREVFDILQELRNRGATIQIIFKVPPYPGGNRWLSAGSHAATGTFSLIGWTDYELWNGGPGMKGLSHFVVFGTHHRILWIAVLER
jgi:transcriptional regulator with XRE-family HTH domain